MIDEKVKSVVRAFYEKRISEPNGLETGYLKTSEAEEITGINETDITKILLYDIPNMIHMYYDRDGRPDLSKGHKMHKMSMPEAEYMIGLEKKNIVFNKTWNKRPDQNDTN